MKMLSLLQAATLVVMGVMQIETRSCPTAYRGPLHTPSKGKAGEILHKIYL
jgi:hypothetical protein